MNCFRHATTDSKKVIDREVKDHFLRVWDTLAKAMDACYLIELHTNPQTRFGKVRLKRAWKKIVADTEELRKRFELQNTEDLAYAAKRELLRIGVDLDEWYRELERERHR